MASIILKELKKPQSTSNVEQFTYADIHLDIIQQNRSISNNNSKNSINGKDIVADNDEAAIRNSITNILNTRQGQRFLIPTFGCNLLKYIGMPVSTTIGKMIGTEIQNAITKWEPRVRIDQITVVSKPDENEYDITVNIAIPALKKRDINIIGTFTSQGILDIREP
jgi:phage baseplate assembly protein W